MMSELSELMTVFEDYLNTMFTGTNSLSANETAISPDISKLKFIPPQVDTISLAEKIKRLPELHDPETIDVQHIQYLASMLGYNVNVNRGEIGTYLAQDSGALSATNLEKYLRFIVLSLPHWYKIKTTENSIKMLLFSFGIVADISYYYTDSYLPESKGGKWRVSDYDMLRSSISELPDNFFPTPHFIIWQDLNLSEADMQWDIEKRTQIINAINSIRPISCVFKNVGAYLKLDYPLNITANTRWNLYRKIESEGSSDSWRT